MVACDDASIRSVKAQSLGRQYVPPYKLWGVSDPGGVALPGNFCPRPGFFRTHPKTTDLAFLKAT